MIKDNPFTSDTFASIWLKHFNDSEGGHSFNFLTHLLFVNHKLPFLYVNCGKTHTKGISYSIENIDRYDFRKKTFLIFDVPTYFNVMPPGDHVNLGNYKVKQYPGYLIELKQFQDINHFLQKSFQKSSRYKLKKYKKRLERCFDIEYKMYFGNITRDCYDQIFKHFKDLLEKRFYDKQIRNNNLDPEEWNFYYDVAYPMIREKKACLFVISDGNKPIGVTLNYLSDEVLFDAITVFDIDYAKFNVGSITILKQIEWCIDRGIHILDFSKGHFLYKERWATKSYIFENHIYYDKNNLLSRITAFSIKMFFTIKQELRKMHVNDMIHKLTFRLRNRRRIKQEYYNYSLIEDTRPLTTSDVNEINHKSEDYGFLKKAVFDFLYTKQEKYKALRVYKLSSEPNNYLFKGQSHQMKTITK